MTVIVTINYDNCTTQNNDSSRRNIELSFLLDAGGRISGEIILVLENTSE